MEETEEDDATEFVAAPEVAPGVRFESGEFGWDDAAGCNETLEVAGAFICCVGPVLTAAGVVGLAPGMLVAVTGLEGTVCVLVVGRETPFTRSGSATSLALAHPMMMTMMKRGITSRTESAE